MSLETCLTYGDFLQPEICSSCFLDDRGGSTFQRNHLCSRYAYLSAGKFPFICKAHAVSFPAFVTHADTLIEVIPAVYDHTPK